MAGKASLSSAKISSNTESSQVELITLPEHEQHGSSTYITAPSNAVLPYLTGWRLQLTTVGYVYPWVRLSGSEFAKLGLLLAYCWLYF